MASMLAQEMTAEQYLRHYLRLLWRRKWIIVLSGLIVGGLSLFFTATQTPLYRSTAEVLLRPRSSESLFAEGAGGYIDPYRDAATQILVITGEPVRERVRAKLGSAPGVTAASVNGTEIVRITAVSTDPEEAREVANAYATSYIEYRRDSDVDDLAQASQAIRQQIDELERQIDGYDKQVQDAPPAQRAAVEETVKSERDGLIAQAVGLRQTFDRIQLNNSLNRGGAQVVTQAQTPLAPFEPRPLKNGASGAIAGLVLGLTLAFVLDLLDDSVKSKEDVERVTTRSGLRVIATIPTVRGWKDRKSTRLIVRDEPSSSPSEAYRTLRTSVQFMGLDRPLRVIQVTSPQAGEGKTTTLANLSVVMARSGQRVVVVCCDLRKPRLHQFYGLKNATGLTSVLVGEASLSQALQSVPGEQNLMLLASGPEPPDPAEVLANMRLVEVLTALQGMADVVLIDSAPVLPVADAAILATRVDGTLLVVSAGASSRKQVHRTLELLGQVEAPLIGVILNRASGDAEFGGYGYGYAYRYGPQNSVTPSASAIGDLSQRRS
jgi:polysaccharide biosynthesis transport protein